MIHRRKTVEKLDLIPVENSHAFEDISFEDSIMSIKSQTID
jgi:hypothetical protein